MVRTNGFWTLAFSVVCGALVAQAARGEAVSAVDETCGNTVCYPTWHYCDYVKNSDCTLYMDSEGEVQCGGFETCKEVEM